MTVPWVSSENVPLQFVHLRRGGVCFLQFGLSVVVAHVVSNSDELRRPVAAGQQDDCDADEVCLGDLLWVGRVGL